MDRFQRTGDPHDAEAAAQALTQAVARYPHNASLVAELAVAVIKDLNPHILRGMTPPGKQFQVRIPEGTAVDFDSAFAALDPSHRVATRRVVVKNGETLTTIARRAGIQVRKVMIHTHPVKVATLR
jgi:hypothetical protein